MFGFRRDTRVFEIVHAELPIVIRTVTGERATVRALRRYERQRARSYGMPSVVVRPHATLGTPVSPVPATDSLDVALEDIHPSLREEYRQAALGLLRLQAPAADLTTARTMK